jgi:Bacteriocin-protection, YdeI or OmpD-Associated/Domain of unknown function (DUF1905)
MANQATKQSAGVSAIHFKAEPFEIGSSTIILLPKAASAKLPSRGMAMVKGTVNGSPFQTELEPDGRGSHWFKVDESMRQAGVEAGKAAAFEVEPIKIWPEPNLPADLKSALANDKKVAKPWDDITPMARWDWLRWISSTGKSETRQRRIGVAFSKLKAGERRPCCFNRTICTDPSVSKGGALLIPA